MRPEHWVYTLPLRLRSLLRRRRVEDELDEELRYHLERQIEANVEKGMSDEEARYAAMRAMGGLEEHKEACRDARRVRYLEDVAADLRFGVRGLLKHRGFAIVAVLTLGLGIGANTAVFSVINAVFLRPLPFREPDRLVAVWEDASFVDYPRNTPSPGNFLDWQAHATSFEQMATMRQLDFSLTGDGTPERLSAVAVTANMFPMLGLEPALGRSFLEEEDRKGGPHAVILGDGIWRRRYGGAEDVLGRQIRLDGELYTIVGVMPRGVQLLDRKGDIFVPMAFGPEDADRRGSHYLDVLARLKPGVSVESAQREMEAIMARIAHDYPDDAARVSATVVPLREEISGDARTPLLVLLVAVGLVLLIACINVGNLMLSRAASRGREIAVRAALGASRLRVLRQLLVENVPLALLGTAVGLVFAWASFTLLRQLVPKGLGAAALELDGRVLGFTLLVALAASILFGLVPAIEASKADLNDTLRRGSARTGVGIGGRLQGVLVVGEVSLAIVLLVGAGLLVRTFFYLRGQYADLQVSSVLTMKTILPKTTYDTHEKRLAFFNGVVDRVRTLPGVTAVGFTNALPLDYKGDSTSFTVEGHPNASPLDTNATDRLVSAGYLRALGVPLRRGRDFTEADGPSAMPVAIVNETMERQYWKGEDALGRRFKIGEPRDDTPWVTVVGIVADVRQNTVEEPAQAEMYFPYAQCDYVEFFAPKTLAIRMKGDQTGLVAAVRREIEAVDPNQPVSDVMTMHDILSEETSSRRLGTTLLGAFAAVALLLASVGLYGLLSQRVAQLTPEVGVRLALGATPRDVLALVVGRGMRLVAIGVAAGLLLSIALTRWMSSLLFGVGAVDPLTLVGVPVLLMLVAFVACVVPARRAARVDPTTALRYE